MCSDMCAEMYPGICLDSTDFIKWKGILFFRFVAVLVDDNSELRLMGKVCFDMCAGMCGGMCGGMCTVLCMGMAVLADDETESCWLMSKLCPIHMSAHASSTRLYTCVHT